MQAHARVDQQRDLYAFGMLLLEMCTSEKPGSELLNRISCAEQLDPVFGRVVRLALGWTEHLATAEPRRNEPLVDESVHASATYFLELLALNEQQRASETVRRSTLAFPSFLHADRYVAATELQQIERALVARDSHFEVAVKRLGAVEQELLDEQSNFAVLVRQFESVEREKQHWTSAAQALEATVQRLERVVESAHGEKERLAAALTRQQRETEQLQMLVEESRGCILKLQDARLADMLEKQGLLIDILKLKDEKRRLQDESHQVEQRAAALAARVGSERDAMVDLEERWKQVTVKWELEQKARRKVERQNEQLHMQLSKMEDERSLYAFELNYCPTGLLDPKQTVEYVLDLKEREVRALHDAMEQALSVQNDLERTISNERHANQLATQVQRQLHARIDELEAHVLVLNGSLETKSSDVARSTAQLHGATAQIASLSDKIADLEDEIERQAKKRADEELARRRRQCLTPQCDAPKYLVGASGFCKECEEKAAKERAASESRRKSRGASAHRRQRSLDSASSRAVALCCNNVKNASVVKLVHAIESIGDYQNRSEEQSDRGRQEDESQLLALIKQLTAVLKADETLKDDLPECRVFKSLLLTMKECHARLAIQLECCKCLSVAVFSHDRNRIILVADGVVEIVLAARQQFPLDVKLLEATSVLLTNLSHNCESNRKRILEAGGVDSVLQAMQAFPQHASVQKKSCWSLLTLADFMCHEIAARGGLGAVLAGMLNCPSDEHVQFYGAWALVNLVSGTSRLQHFARREGVAEVAEAALACFPDHPGIQEKAHEVLQLLSHTRTSA